MMTKQHCMRFYISGKVQGVWFRASTKEQAVRLQLTGWARNLPDGRVEVMVAGEVEQVAKLHEWLKHGPPLADVTDVLFEEMPWEAFEGFKTL